MAEQLRISDMLQMAVQDEKAGLAFYSELVKVAKSELVKKAAQRFAAQEKGHLKLFSDMLKAAAASAAGEAFDAKYLNYVRELLKSNMFPPEGEAVALARDAKTDKDAVSIGVTFERNTLLFFGEVRNFVPMKNQDTVEKIMDEERQHMVDLCELRRQL